MMGDPGHQLAYVPDGYQLGPDPQAGPRQDDDRGDYAKWL